MTWSLPVSELSPHPLSPTFSLISPHLSLSSHLPLFPTFSPHLSLFPTFCYPSPSVSYHLQPTWYAPTRLTFLSVLEYTKLTSLLESFMTWSPLASVLPLALSHHPGLLLKTASIEKSSEYLRWRRPRPSVTWPFYLPHHGVYWCIVYLDSLNIVPFISQEFIFITTSMVYFKCFSNIRWLNPHSDLYILFSDEEMEAQKLPQGHPAWKWQNPDLNPSSLFESPCCWMEGSSLPYLTLDDPHVEQYLALNNYLLSDWMISRFLWRPWQGISMSLSWAHPTIFLILRLLVLFGNWDT